MLKTDTRLLDCSLTGWYHGVRPLDALEKIESSLKESALEEKEILARVARAFQAEKIEIDQCPPADLVKVIMKSVRGKKRLPV